MDSFFPKIPNTTFSEIMTHSEGDTGMEQVQAEVKITFYYLCSTVSHAFSPLY